MHLSNEVQRICTGSCKHLKNLDRNSLSKLNLWLENGELFLEKSEKEKAIDHVIFKNSNFFNGVKVAFLSNGCSFQVAAFESFEMLIDLQYQWKRLRLRSSEAAVLLRKLIQMTLQLDNSYTILNPNSTQFVSPSLSSLPFFPPKKKRTGKQKFWSSSASSILVKTRQPI